MRNPSRFLNRGYSIVELMISMTIGLLIIAAIGVLYVANKQTFLTQDDASRLQETSQAVFDILGYHIRQAGFVDISDDSDRVKMMLDPANSPKLKNYDTISLFFGAAAPYVGVRALQGCDGLFSSLTSVAPPWSCGPSGASSLIIAYQARPTEADGITVRTTTTYLDTLGSYDPTTGIGGDCGAKDVSGGSANPAGPLAINMFYVDSATRRLMCVGSGNPSNPRPIAEGVEDMVILYGISPASAGAAPLDSFAGRYVKAADVSDWSKVLAIRACVQIAAPTQTRVPVPSYTDCNGVTQLQSDGKLRRMFRATFSLRNNILSTPDSL